MGAIRRHGTSQQLLSENAHFRVVRELNESLGVSTIVKSTSQEHPTKQDIARLKSEFQILSELNDAGVDGISKVVRFDVDAYGCSIVMEDNGGMALSDLLSAPLPLEKFYLIAEQILSALSSIHDQNVVHCDLKPDNILCSSHGQNIRIVDFGSARRLVGRGQFAQTLSATMAFIAPEQTGRVNRRIDHRTDFYTLGVTFYRMLSGRLPFEAADALGWIHAHIAKHAAPLYGLKLNIPLSLSRMIEKMLRKSPEDRYQSADGILADLRAIATIACASREDLEFQIGRSDHARRFMLTQKIVGREDQIADLLRTWKKISSTQQLAFIAGEPGTGKTAVVREFIKHLGSQRGLITQAKHDSRRRHIPFSALSIALSSLLEQVLRGPVELAELAKAEVAAAIGDGAGALLPMIPNLSALLGPVDPLDVVSLEASRARQCLALESFLNALIVVCGPITLYLDDLQFIDETSDELLTRLFYNRNVPGLLLVVAFQPTSAQHAILNGEGLQIDVSDLHLPEVTEFIAETLNVLPDQVHDLAEAVFSKSGGNPFFVNQIFKDLFDEKLIVFNKEKGWGWDIAAIRATTTATSVIDLLSLKFAKLPESSKEVLKIGSCFGGQFSAADLTALNGRTEEENQASLAVAVDFGLIFFAEDQNYRFIHERVREFTYQSVETTLRNETHAKLGLKMLEEIEIGGPKEHTFVTVGHLISGLSVIQDTKVLMRIANLCLEAAKIAKAAAAFSLVCDYAESGLRACSWANWNDSSDLLFSLHLLMSESQYLIGRYEESEKTFEYLRRQTKDPIDQIHLRMAYIRLLSSEGQHHEVVRSGLATLKEQGLHYSKNPSYVLLIIKFLILQVYLKLRSFPQPTELGVGASRLQVLQCELLRLVSQSAYFVNKKMFLNFLITPCLRAFQIGLERDWCIGLSVFSLINAKQFDDYEGAKKIYKHSLGLPKEQLSTRGRSLLLFTEAAFLQPWIGPWDEAMTMLRTSLTYAKQQGELTNAGFASLYLCFHSIYCHENFEEIEEEIEQQFVYLRTLRNQALYDCARPTRLFVELMKGRTLRSDTFSSEEFSEDGFRALLNKHQDRSAKTWFVIHKLLGLYLMGHYDQAAALLIEAGAANSDTPLALANLTHELFSALLYLRHARGQRGQKLVRLKNKIRKSLKKIKVWARNNPLQFGAAALLLEAEFAGLEGRSSAVDSYERASVAARISGQWMMGIVVNECAGRFLAGLGNTRLGETYIRDAIYAAHRWGASAKVALLVKEFPDAARNRPSTSGQGFTTSLDFMVATDQLDLHSATKAALALNSELNMNELLKKLTLIAMESAAASRGILFMSETGGTGTIGSDTAPLYRIKQIAGSESSEYPSSIVDFVFKSGQELVLDDARSSEIYGFDPYVRSEQPVSVVCLPIQHKDRVQGVLYMENNTATGVFSEGRLRVLNVVLAQAAVSIENARLYSEVSSKVRMEAELKTARTVQETLFPAGRAQFSNFEIMGHYEPASECGGDWWHYHAHENKVFVYIGDATGHGASAALMTSAARSAVSLFSTLSDLSPVHGMKLLNRAICETSKNTMNMTFLICAFDAKKSELTYCNASHEAPLVISKSVIDQVLTKVGEKGDAAGFREFRKCIETGGSANGPRLGESLDSVYTEVTIPFSPGDVVVLLSDGVCDLKDVDGKEWGYRRFIRAVYQAIVGKALSAEKVNSEILRAAESYRQAMPLSDDFTLITCFQKPSKGA